MKFMLLASAAAVVSAQLVDLDDTSVSVRERFEAFEQRFDKAYATKDEREKAFRTFANNDKRVQDVNSQGLEYTFGHNEFSDLTADEFADMMISGYEAPSRDLDVETSLSDVDVESLPKSVDWVNAGAVNPIKNQGQCGSCWAFSTVMGIEGDLFVETGALLDLSEQDLVSCDPVDQGCNGGLMDQAFQYVEKNGICNETDYPYTAGTGTSGQCEKTCTPAVKITGYKDVPAKDEDALQAAVAQQPVSVAIEADRSVFQLYKSGVLSSPFCGTQLDHGVGIVGYGSSAFNTPYWKVRNSWGESWGMQGYVLLKRGSNECGISQQASYPTGAHQI